MFLATGRERAIWVENEEFRSKHKPKCFCMVRNVACCVHAADLAKCFGIRCLLNQITMIMTVLYTVLFLPALRGLASFVVHQIAVN